MSLRTKRIGSLTRGLGVAVMVGSLMLGTTIARSADSPQAGMMAAPPPMKDSMLMSWVGTWGGDAKMGDQTMYGEATFTSAIGHQWVQGSFHMWTDKTKKSPAMMEFVMYVRPGTAPGTYKAVGVGNDGTGSVASVTLSNGVCKWVWTYDNDTKEVGTLTRMAADHLVYAATVSDKAGNKVMDMHQDMMRMNTKATVSH